MIERPPKAVHFPPSLDSPGRDWISRKRSDQQSVNHSTIKLSSCLESLPQSDSEEKVYEMEKKTSQGLGKMIPPGNFLGKTTPYHHAKIL